MRKHNQPVRVCFLIDALATAGTETQLLALLRAIDRRKVEPYLVLLRGDSETSRALEPTTCPVTRLGVGSLLRVQTLGKAWSFMQFLRRERIDVVQAYFPDSQYFGVPLAWLAGVSHRIRTRNNIGHWLTRSHRFLGRLLNGVTTKTIANCDAAREALLVAEKPNPESVMVLRNGVDLQRFLDIPEPTQRRVRVGMVGNLREVKGIDVLIRAMAMVRQEFPDVETVVGGEGDQRSALQSLIAQLGLSDRFHLPGQCQTVPEFLASVDLAVLSSRAEGMSNGVLEYMAAARPIVATNVGAMRELLPDEEHGLLVPPNDPQALAQAIASLLRDRERAARLGRQARRRAVQEFSREVMVRRFEDFYLNLMSEAQHARATEPVSLQG
jgi:glycosyltransferase involved in cell wall biosynthesis